MSVRLMAAVFELNLPPAKKIVLLAMADHAQDDGTGCYPSIARLAKKTSMSRRGVQKIIRQLQRAQFVTSKGAGLGGRALTTEYQITLEKGEPGSLFQKTKGRTGRPKRANLSAEKGEPGSPESSLTVMNRKAAAAEKAEVTSKAPSKPEPKQESIWGFLGIEPCGPLAFRNFIEGCWSSRNGDLPLEVISRALDAWEDTEGEMPPRCKPLFRALAKLRERQPAAPVPKPSNIPGYAQMIPTRGDA